MNCKICGIEDKKHCSRSCMNNVYQCRLCGTSRGNHMFMAETLLCADCLNPIGFPDYLPIEQHLRYVHIYIRKVLKERKENNKNMIKNAKYPL